MAATAHWSLWLYCFNEVVRDFSAFCRDCVKDCQGWVIRRWCDGLDIMRRPNCNFFEYCVSLEADLDDATIVFATGESPAENHALMIVGNFAFNV